MPNRTSTDDPRLSSGGARARLSAQEASGPPLAPLRADEHLLEPIITRAEQDPFKVVAAYREGPGFVDVSLAVTNTGWIELRDGVLRSSRRLVLAGGELRLAGGRLELDTDLILDTPPLLLVGGTLSGAGSITFTNDNFTSLTLTNLGTVIRPGAPIGILRVGPHFSQRGAWVLEVEIAGAGAGVGHDQLAAAGRARMEGTLHLVLRDGFVPAIGQEFDLVTGTSIGGDRFTTVEGAAIASDRHFEIIYQQQRIVARCVAGP